MKETWRAHCQDDDGVYREVELTIDLRWLVSQLGKRALRNKGQRCSAIAEAIIVTVVKEPKR